MKLIAEGESNSSTVNINRIAIVADKTNSLHSKVLEKHKRLVTAAISDWVCSNSRPINIVEGDGLKNLIEQCIKIGIPF